ncbi:hypothetical protein [Wenzhouxiangella marina]|uniref:Uncharacterized protein n=1 Tax=Wenzhouxiangella marina TaxID=1579979 RepID=A0A0K0Y0D2_9GAMM|nr:hypothetical protein [Wenzhouxiangella marina]AKS43394.1 hypothetical protein WM2015_3042 [Wenzhouxiangella marina]MBB6088490.1 heme/copper-type cytochrome/quinol oxidase subunit 2 [Wenzhouxiangella marina]
MSQNPYAPPKSDLQPPVEDAPAIWNPNAAGLWSLLFTPIFGASLVMKNWKAMGQPDRAGAAMIWVIVSIVMIIPSIFIPFLGLVYLIVWYFSNQRPQAVYVRERWGQGYPRRSWALPLILAVAVLFGGFFLLGFLAAMLVPAVVN